MASILTMSLRGSPNLTELEAEQDVFTASKISDLSLQTGQSFGGKNEKRVFPFNPTGLVVLNSVF